MSQISPSPSPAAAEFRAPERRWRTVDIVVMAMVGSVFGVIYWAWAYFPASSIFASIPPVAAVTYALFVMAGPLGALIIRRPGAALGAELLAALFEALVGVHWSGTSVIVYGLVEGAAAEIVFLLLRYRRWGLPAAVSSGAAAGAAMALLDVWIYRVYPEFSAAQQGGYLIFAVIGGAVIAGGLSWFLVRALAATGVLSPFPSGREQNLV